MHLFAKVTRDNEITKLKEILGKDIGSGYPSDPKTKTFIKNEIKMETSKKYIRFSWKPVKQIIKKNLQTTLFC